LAERPNEALLSFTRNDYRNSFQEMNRFLQITILICLWSLSFNPQAYALRCHQTHILRSHLIEAEPFEQANIWEQENNSKLFLKSREAVEIPYSIVPAENLNVTFSSLASEAIKDFVSTPIGVRWYKHPFNKNASVPYFRALIENSVSAFQTASRSLTFKIGDDAYSIKMATDHPHGPNGPKEPKKATTKEDLIDGLNRSKYFERVEAEIGEDPMLILAKDVAFIEHKETGEGFLIRALSYFKSGHYYLPALSLPYVGRAIADHNGTHADLFWQKHYAAALGQAKAKFLLRYGAQMEFPHPQNILIELDRNLKPTGRIVFRDLSDTVLVDFVMIGLGESEVLASDRAAKVTNTREIQPNWRNSTYTLDDAGKDSIQSLTLSNWGGAHEKAYLFEIENALGVDLSEYRGPDSAEKLGTFLKSPLGQKHLQAYRERLKREHQMRQAQ